MNVSFVDYPKQHAKYPEIEEAILRVCRSRARILQNEVKTFEEGLAKFVGTKYALGVANGTDALIMVLRYLKQKNGWQDGDEVISVGHTFHATIEAIVHNGLTPVLVDVGEDGMMNVFEVEKVITPKTKAILPVHLMGDMVDMHRLGLLVQDQNLNRIGNKISLVEDACQALGSEFRWQTESRKAGSISSAGAFSFFPAKILGCYGDGGGITTNDEELYNEIKNMREHYKFSEHPGFGFNSRLDELQASILNVKIKYLPDMLRRRQEIADLYFEGLKDLEKAGKIKLPTKRNGRVFQDYIIQVPDIYPENYTKDTVIFQTGDWNKTLFGKRDALADFLKEQGIETLKNDYHFPIPKPEHTVKLESQTLRLPCNDVLEDDEIKYVIQKVNEFYQK